MVRFAMALLALAGSVPAYAKVHEVSERGFVIRHVNQVPAAPEETWSTLLSPSKWWSGAHTFSGDEANLSIDPKAGGCFCEVLPDKEFPESAPLGQVEHMRVVYLERPRVLRLSGALGPLQRDAAQGSLTIMLKPVESGTQILWEFVAGGYFRAPSSELAQAMDVVLAIQAKRLAVLLGATRLDDSPQSEMSEDGDLEDRSELGGEESRLNEVSPANSGR